MARVSIFLTTLALIAGMVGCGTTTQYALSIYSTAGGNVTHPGIGTFVYPVGAVVLLEAVPTEGYSFIHWSGNVSTIVDVNAPTTTITMSSNYFITANFAQYTPMVSAGALHTVGLRSDGTVVAAGTNDTMPDVFGLLTGWCDVGNWTNIVQVSAGWLYTVGLKSDGTVVGAGFNTTLWGVTPTPLDVGNWTDIIQISAGIEHTVGLTSEGTVVAVGTQWDPYPYYGWCDVGNWTDITQVVAGWRLTVGLRSDGTVIAIGDNSTDQCDVGNWTNIVQVAAGGNYTVGLKSDGTVIAVGDNSYGQCDVGNWTNIVQVVAGWGHTVGLRSDGTVIAVGDNSTGQCDVGNWTNVVQVAAGGGNAHVLGIPAWTSGGHTVGLRSDGTVAAVGDNSYSQCNVTDWDLN